MHEIKCSEVWGGIRDQDEDVTAAGLAASLYSAACEGGKGGDIYYLSVCAGGELTRVVIADVVGHGSIVSDVSQGLYDSLQDHMDQPDGAQVLADLNGIAIDRGVSSIATAAVIGYFSVNGAGLFACAGHPPTLVKRHSAATWEPMQQEQTRDVATDLPLGVAPEVTYGQGTTTLERGDRLLLYTDGVIEAPNASGEPFGADRLVETLSRVGDAPLADLKNGVLDAVRGHTGGALTHDDVTIIALEVR